MGAGGRFANTSGVSKKEYSERRLIGYSMDEMFRVISAVPEYAEFVPYCRRSRVIGKKKKGDGVVEEVKMEVGFPPFLTETFVSTVLTAGPHLVKAVCTESTFFKHLVCDWRFGPGLPSDRRTCSVEFSVSFELHSQWHSNLADVYFDRLVRQQVDTFLDRAQTKYGLPAIPPQPPIVIKRVNI